MTQLDLPWNAGGDDPSRPVETRPNQLVIVRHRRARRYILRVLPDGTPRVTIPRWGSKREALRFADRHRRWIAREQQACRERRAARTADAARELQLRRLAADELPARLLALAARHGLRLGRVSVRSQRTRWGSCGRNGHITLNWRLVEVPPAVCDYVMVHELMHLKEPNHSPRFWRLVRTACPDYEKARQWLRRHGPGLWP